MLTPIDGNRAMKALKQTFAIMGMQVASVLTGRELIVQFQCRECRAQWEVRGLTDFLWFKCPHPEKEG